MNPDPYVSLKITAVAREQLHRWTLTLSARAGRRLTLGDALTAACAVAERHVGEALDTLANGETADRSDSAANLPGNDRPEGQQR